MHPLLNIAVRAARRAGDVIVEVAQEQVTTPKQVADKVKRLRDENRRLRDALVGSGVEHAYAERNAGHNWVNWRNGLAAGLRFALPPA